MRFIDYFTLNEIPLVTQATAEVDELFFGTGLKIS